MSDSGDRNSHPVGRFGTPFRIGSTSYVYPADILPNVEKLAADEDVDDIELILFEVDDGPNNLPSEAVIGQIDVLAKTANITFTVHLPLDLTLAADGTAQHESLIKARRVIERTTPLDPFAFVFHLDGSGLNTQGWVDRSLRALDEVMKWVSDPALLAVENLENYPPDYLDPVLARAPISRTTDIGHFWKMGLDPLDYLEKWLPRTRVIHIHGMADRDHHSLALTPTVQLDPVMAILMAGYQGVVTLEVFETSDFFGSRTALVESVKRVVPTFWSPPETWASFVKTRFDPRSTDELIQTALTCCTDEENDPGLDALHTLRQRATREVYDATLKLYESKIPHNRAIACSIIAQLGFQYPPEKRPFLDERIAFIRTVLETETAPEVLRDAGVAAGYLGTDELLDSLLKLINHFDENVRYGVTNSLHSEDPRAVAALIKLSADSDDDVRDWSSMWLGQLCEDGVDTPEVRDALYARIAEDDPSDAYGEALVGLAHARDPRADAAIIDALSRDYDGYMVFDAAGLSHDPKVLEALLDFETNDEIALWLENTIKAVRANIEADRSHV